MIHSNFRGLFVSVLLCVATSAHAAALVPIQGYSFTVLSSVGQEAKARELADRCEKAFQYFVGLYKSKPAKISLLALSKSDWSQYSVYPAYGMPNYANGELTVATESNDLWDSFVEIIRQNAPEAYKVMEQVYGRSGKIEMSQFFDLLVVHELAHSFQEQGGVRLPRLWLNELFANLSLHSYISENEPAQLPVLLTAPAILAGMDPNMLPFHTLSDFEGHYSDMDPQNYGWYQAKFHSAAAQVYDAAGASPAQAVWSAFLNHNSSTMQDNELLVFLESRGAGKVAEVARTWPK